MHLSCICSHGLCLQSYGDVGLDVHKMHVISRGIYKSDPMYNLPAEICFASSRTTRRSQSQSHTGQRPLSKEVYVIEDAAAASAPEKSDNAWAPENLTTWLHC
uniref:Uncharacterized protein n=1 Tax=Arundo donax TaxID=35708 RepID=A0A0A9DMF1_ARUDO